MHFRRFFLSRNSRNLVCKIFGPKIWSCKFFDKSHVLQEVHYYMVYIAYFTELNLQNCDYVQKRTHLSRKL